MNISVRCTSSLVNQKTCMPIIQNTTTGPSTTTTPARTTQLHCQNGGTPNQGTHTCNCPPLFTGKYCQNGKGSIPPLYSYFHAILMLGTCLKCNVSQQILYFFEARQEIAMIWNSTMAFLHLASTKSNPQVSTMLSRFTAMMDGLWSKGNQQQESTGYQQKPLTQSVKC